MLTSGKERPVRRLTVLTRIGGEADNLLLCATTQLTLRARGETEGPELRTASTGLLPGPSLPLEP